MTKLTQRLKIRLCKNFVYKDDKIQPYLLLNVATVPVNLNDSTTELSIPHPFPQKERREGKRETCYLITWLYKVRHA